MVEVIHRKTKKPLSVSKIMRPSDYTTLNCFCKRVLSWFASVLFVDEIQDQKGGGTRVVALCVDVCLSVGKGIRKVDF